VNMSKEYWIDADGYLVYGIREKDEWESVAEIPQHHVEPLSKIIATVPDLLAACEYYKNECSGAEPSLSVFERMLERMLEKLLKKQNNP